MVNTLFEKVDELFEQVKEFDSKVYFNIPKIEIVDADEYRHWFLQFEEKWMTEFNGNKNYWPRSTFNEESGIAGSFSGVEIHYCKFYRFDGTLPSYFSKSFRHERGVLIRDHFENKYDVVKVHFVADNFEDFLKQEQLPYQRTNFPRPWLINR